MKKFTFFLIILQLGSWTEIQANSCDHDFYRPNYISRSSLCALGELVPDQYDGGKLILCEKMEIDHLVSLKQAWENGVCGLELKKLANDPDNLRTTFWLTNRQKGRKSPVEFAKGLNGKSKINVLRDTEVIYSRYSIVSKKKIIDLKFARLTAKGSAKAITMKKLVKKYGKKLTKKIVGKRTLYYAGGRLVAVGASVGTAIAIYEVSDWAYTNLFLPKDTEQSSKREEKMANFFESINR